MSKLKIGPLGLLALLIVAVSSVLYAAIQPPAPTPTATQLANTQSTKGADQSAANKTTPTETVNIGNTETDPEPEDPDLISDVVETPTKANTQVDEKTTIIKPTQSGGAKVYDKFVPSESISEDLAVSFPVDI